MLVHLATSRCHWLFGMGPCSPKLLRDSESRPDCMMSVDTLVPSRLPAPAENMNDDNPSSSDQMAAAASRKSRAETSGVHVVFEVDCGSQTWC